MIVVGDAERVQVVRVRCTKSAKIFPRLDFLFDVLPFLVQRGVVAPEPCVLWSENGMCIGQRLLGVLKLPRLCKLMAQFASQPSGPRMAVQRFFCPLTRFCAALGSC